MRKGNRSGKTGHNSRRSVGALRAAACFLLAAWFLTACGAADSTGRDAASTAAYSGMDYLTAGDYSTAAEVYQDEINNGRATEENYRGLGIAMMGLGSYRDAAAAFEDALDHAGAVPGAMEYDINYYLGSCYYKLEEYDKALEVYDAIVTLRPGDADALVCRGTVKMALDDADGMKEDYLAAIRLDMSDYDRIIEIYEKMDAFGYAEDGKTYLTEVLDTQGDSMDNYSRGRLSYCIGDYQTAKSCLEKEGDSRGYDAAILLGKTYEALGDYNYAKSVYETYLSRDTTHAEVYNQLGLCCVQMEDYQSALTAFQNGLAVGESAVTQSLEYNQIVVYEYLGDFQRAAVLIQEYLKEYPEDEAAQREYLFLKTR